MKKSVTEIRVQRINRLDRNLKSEEAGRLSGLLGATR